MYGLCPVSPVVGLHCRRQCIPPIATSSRTSYREQVLIEHENAAMKAKQRTSRFGSNVLANNFRTKEHGEKNMFEKVSVFMLDVYNDAQRGTVSAWKWPFRILT